MKVKQEGGDKVAQILSSGKSQEDIQKDLEREMQKRREKVALWRSANKKENEKDVLSSKTASDDLPNGETQNGSKSEEEIVIKTENTEDEGDSAQQQGWSLENDEDDDDDDDATSENESNEKSEQVINCLMVQSVLDIQLTSNRV